MEKVENKPLTLDMKVSDITENFPETKPLFLDMNMACYICDIASNETLEQAAKTHNLNPNDTLDELNEWILKTEKELSKKGYTRETIKNLEFIDQDDEFFDDFF